MIKPFSQEIGKSNRYVLNLETLNMIIDIELLDGRKIKLNSLNPENNRMIIQVYLHNETQKHQTNLDEDTTIYKYVSFILESNSSLSIVCEKENGMRTITCDYSLMKLMAIRIVNKLTQEVLGTIITGDKFDKEFLKSELQKIYSQ
jgi:hypothetical protein